MSNGKPISLLDIDHTSSIFRRMAGGKMGKGVLGEKLEKRKRFAMDLVWSLQDMGENILLLIITIIHTPFSTPNKQGTHEGSIQEQMIVLLLLGGWLDINNRSNNRQNRKMQKFKPIQADPPLKRTIVRLPKTTRHQERTRIAQLPNTTGVRNLRPSPPVASPFETAINLDTKTHQNGTSPQHYPHSFKIPACLQKRPNPRKAASKRCSTEQQQSIHEHHLQSLKHHIQDLSYRDQPLRKDQTATRQHLSDAFLAAQRKQFLMGQVSFTHIDEERVMAQKKYLERFEYVGKSVPKKIRESGSRRCGMGEGSQARMFQCMRTIDRIYGLLREMDGAGYPLKNNRYMIHYCTVGKLWLNKAFLHQSDQKRDAFTIDVKYLVNHNPQDSKMCFAQFASNKRGEELRIVQEELQGLYTHLEQSLAQKKVNEVINMASYIQGRLQEDPKTISRSLRLTTAPKDKMKLTQDLQGIQEKFGAMRNITKISRKRYDQLNRTYDKLQAML